MAVPSAVEVAWPSSSQSTRLDAVQFWRMAATSCISTVKDEALASMLHVTGDGNTGIALLETRRAWRRGALPTSQALVSRHLSLDPNRERNLSVIRTEAKLAGTRQPIWARMAMQPTWRKNVDLPLIFAPLRWNQEEGRSGVHTPTRPQGCQRPDTPWSHPMMCTAAASDMKTLLLWKAPSTRSSAMGCRPSWMARGPSTVTCGGQRHVA